MHDVIFTYQYIRINTYIYNTIKHCKMVDISRYVRYSLLLDYCSYEKTQLSPKIISTSSRRLPKYSIAIILLRRTKVRDHHRNQPHGTKIVRGEIIIKEINTKNK